MPDNIPDDIADRMPDRMSQFTSDRYAGENVR